MKITDYNICISTIRWQLHDFIRDGNSDVWPVLFCSTSFMVCLCKGNFFVCLYSYHCILKYIFFLNCYFASYYEWARKRIRTLLSLLHLSSPRMIYLEVAHRSQFRHVNRQKMYLWCRWIAVCLRSVVADGRGWQTSPPAHCGAWQDIPPDVLHPP